MALSPNMRGALFMASAMSLFTVNDACMKALAGEVPLFQVIFLRGVLTTALIALYLMATDRRAFILPSKERTLVALRALAEAGAAVFFFAALFNMPLANLSAILQALPLTVTFAAWLFLKEPVGWRRLSAILVGLCGVLLIVRPDADGFSLHAGFALLAVVFATTRDVLTRKLAPGTSSMTVTFATSAMVTVAAGIGSLFVTWVPLTLTSGGLIGIASILILGAYLTIVLAMRQGELSFVAPFRYTSLLVAIVLGVVFFGEWPDTTTFLGAAIVVGSGLYTLHRERYAVPRPTVPTSTGKS
ncbi:DMT family transporter [Aestuariibius insulae]|uniref:DMT family transporter n=1 Tax=Aestuariibius insulae TaxID=2058287 RepID=UPI00345E5E9E